MGLREKYKKEYCEGVVDNWVKEIQTLCDIADTQPQAAFAAYTKGYKHKFNYFLRTIENFEQFVTPVEQLLNDKFIPTIFDSDTPIDHIVRDLVSLKPCDGGLGINIPSIDSKQQDKASTYITKPHVESILEQNMIIKDTDSDGKTMLELKTESKRRLRNKKVEI